MPLTVAESVVLWGVPIATILISFGYYLRWGKEAEEVASDPDDGAVPETDGGGA